MEWSIETLGLRVKGILYLALMWTGVALGLFGLVIFVSQIALWLKSGEWFSLPVLCLLIDTETFLSEQFEPQQLEAFAQHRFDGWLFSLPILISVQEWHIYLGFFSNWLTEPKDWIGLHNVVRPLFANLPLALFLCLVGGLAAFFGMLGWVIAEDNIAEVSRGDKGHS